MTSLQIKSFPLSFFLLLLGLPCLLFSAQICFGEQQVKPMSLSYEIYISKPITNTKILPDTYPLPGSQGREMVVTACRGEYEPATFTVHSLHPLKNLVVSATDLKSEQSAIFADMVDIRVVKCWFQSGVSMNETNKCVLTPELLLKDDDLVRVDLKEKINYVRSGNVPGEGNYLLVSANDSKLLKDLAPQDAETLQPVSLEAGTNKQFWITVQVPEAAKPGLYHGMIKLTAANAPPAQINLQVRVLPFTLEKPALRYAIYYRGKLTRYNQGYLAESMHNGTPVINSEWKTPQQYLAEMRDLKAHGVDYPTLYQQDELLLQKELEIREKAGLPKGPLFSCGVTTYNSFNPKQIEALQHKVTKLLQMAKKSGYEDVFVYGIDEVQGERLKSQRAAWDAVHRVGGKIFVACYRGAFEAMGDLLDLGVLGTGPHPDPKEARKYHQVGHLIFDRYPHVGLEEPETYRRHVGVQLMNANYDGAMHYAYQHPYGHIWDDFDSGVKMRDHVFAYPTVNGVVDTIQWEGFREGVDDVRYLTTLLKAIQEAPANKRQVALEAQKWVNGINPQGDLDAIRKDMIDWILKLQ